MKGTILFGIAFLGGVALQSFSIPDMAAFASVGRYAHMAELMKRDGGTYTIDSPLVKSASESVVMIEKRKDVPVKEIRIERRSDGFHITISSSTTTKNMTVSSGSGFFVTEDGYLLTNKHVVSDDTAEYVVQDGNREMKARVVYRDADHDIAVLKVNGSSFPTLNLSSPNKLKLGDSVTALGNAWGEYMDSAATGTISSLDEDIQVADSIKRQNGKWTISNVTLSDLIEVVNMRLSPGDSGGPLLNQQGEVIGVTVAMAIDDVYGYAIPAHLAKDALVKAGVSK
jgi:S1-C subfamily serine protease